MNKNISLMLPFLIMTAMFIVIFEPVSADSNVEPSWTTKASMPQAKGGVKAVVVNQKIYVIASDATYEYDPLRDIWITKEPMPTLRSNFGIAVFESKIYVIGGSTGDNTYTGVNEVYNPSTNSWETKQSMLTPRWLLEANVVNDKIYLIGGMGGRNVNEVYDLETDLWSKKTPPPISIDHYASAVVDNKIYIFGGQEGGGSFTNRVQIYNPEDDSWSYGQPAPQKVISGTAGVTSGKHAPKRVYVLSVTEYIGIGMEMGETIPPVINQVFDPETNSWIIGVSPPINRLGIAVAVVNDKLYAIGGYTYEEMGSHVPHVPSAINEEYTPPDYQTLKGIESTKSEIEPSTSSFVVAVVTGTPIIITVLSIILIVYFKKYRQPAS
jgi:N-acetylneuraminic acid mutarotase